MEIYKLSNVPDSLYYIPNFISSEEEEHLLSCVNNVPRTRWVQLRNRRLQNWGGQPHTKGMIQTESLPKWLEPFTERLLQMDDETIFPSRTFPFNHCLVNEYHAGQGIMPHTDGPVYYPIVTTISLQSSTVIEFYRPIDNERNEVRNYVPSFDAIVNKSYSILKT
jgi:alkylated DNA repair protein alkB homolog 6